MLSCIILYNDEEDVADGFLIRDQFYSPGLQFFWDLYFLVLQNRNKIKANL